MTIEIQQPELEALIQQRLNSGRFQNVEEVLIEALKSSREEPVNAEAPKQNFNEFMLNSPLRGSGINLERVKDYPREIDL